MLRLHVAPPAFSFTTFYNGLLSLDTSPLGVLYSLDAVGQ
jgi:hypothetical protein